MNASHSRDKGNCRYATAKLAGGLPSGPILSGLSQTPPVSTTLAKLLEKFSAGVIDTGGKFAAGVVDTGGNFAPGVVDTGGAHWLGNISAIFEKTLIYEKVRSKKSRDAVPLVTDES
jgi:hypothetical protein